MCILLHGRCKTLDVCGYHELHSWHVEIFQLTESFIQWHRQQVAELYSNIHSESKKHTRDT